MAITGTDNLIETIGFLMGAVSDTVTEEQKLAAISQATSELSWVIPNTDEAQCHWIIERTRRHLLYVIAIESARKFQYKQIRLNQRFNHYFQLIEKMDEDYAKAIDDNPSLFPSTSGTWLTTYLPCDFVYDQAGKDLTYDEIL